jgi:heat shock protein HtpX
VIQLPFQIVCADHLGIVTLRQQIHHSPVQASPLATSVAQYAADNLGARISGRPDALASALVKISRIAEAVPNDTAETHPTTAPLFIVNPLSGRGMDNLFSTHPSTENRVAALENLSREMGLGSFEAAALAGATRSRGPWE